MTTQDQGKHGKGAGARRHLAALLAGLAAVAAGAACASGGAKMPPATADGAAAAQEAPAGGATAPAAPAAAATPEQSAAATAPAAPAATSIRVKVDPDTDPTAVSGWLVDPENGERYYIASMPKGALDKKLPDGTYRTRYGGIAVAVDSMDEDFVYYRVYDVSGIETMPRRKQPTAEELAAIAASYQVDTPEVDRVSLRPFDRGLPRSGQWRNGFVLVDINGDGNLDIVHGPPRKHPGSPRIFLGDGAGGWTPWREATYPRRAFDYGDVAVADFDGDGRPDIALAMHLLGSAVMVQREPGRFVDWSAGLDYETPSNRGTAFSSRALAAADWNGDGRPDLVEFGEGPRLAVQAGTVETRNGSYGPRVYLNQGDGSWVPYTEGQETRQQAFGDSLAVADLDGDGRLDFTTSTGLMSYREVVYLGQDGSGWKPVEIDGLRRSAYLTGTGTGDFDGDGVADPAYAYRSYEGGTWRSGIDVFLHRSDGWARAPVTMREDRVAFTGLATGDVDGDGHTDLVALDEDGTLSIFLGDGTGGFAREASPEIDASPGRCEGYHAVVRDIDGDGRPEIVASFASEPGSEVMLSDARCPSEGSLRAWTVAPR